MSSAIAAYRLGYSIDLCELDPEYFAKGAERVALEMRQKNLFNEAEAPKPEQMELFNYA